MTAIKLSTMSIDTKSTVAVRYASEIGFTTELNSTQITQSDQWQIPIKKTLKQLLTLGVGSIVCSLLLEGAASGAILTEIDFNDLPSETIVTDQFSDLGVTFSLVDDSPLIPAPPNPGPLLLPLFLDFPPASGIGLFAGDSCCDPATDVWFDIALDFTETIDYLSVLALDADEPASVLGFFDGDLVQSTSLPGGSDTQVYQLELGDIGGDMRFDRVVFSAYPDGPEAFDNLVYNRVSESETETVPEPSTMLSLILMAGISFYSMKRKVLHSDVVKTHQ